VKILIKRVIGGVVSLSRETRRSERRANRKEVSYKQGYLSGKLGGKTGKEPKNNRKERGTVNKIDALRPLPSPSSFHQVFFTAIVINIIWVTLKIN
jgi:hypothetical protein